MIDAVVHPSGRTAAAALRRLHSGPEWAHGLARKIAARRAEAPLLDFDFGAYADEHFSRIERTAAEPRFRDALTPSDRHE